jgi:hypothetical protein
MERGLRHRHLAIADSRCLETASTARTQGCVELRLCVGYTVGDTRERSLGFENYALTKAFHRYVITGIIRVVSILKVDFKGDITNTVIDGEIWGMAKVGIGIIISCSPILRPVFEKMIPHSLLSLSFRKPFT